MKAKNHYAFTLTELLVTIAIIAALVVILLPVSNYLNEQAKRTGCINNLRTYGSACLNLIVEKGLPWWDGETGSKMGDGSVYPNFPDWLIDGGYLSDARVLRCPKATEADRERTYGMRYAGNSGFCIYYPKNVFSIPYPHSLVALAAEGYSGNFNIAGHFNRAMWGNDDGTANPQTEGSEKKWPTPQFHGTRERRGMNVMFLDGHAETIYPVDSDWRKEPFYGATGNGGYIYDRDQLRRVKNGTLRYQ